MTELDLVILIMIVRHPRRETLGEINGLLLTVPGKHTAQLGPKSKVMGRER